MKAFFKKFGYLLICVSLCLLGIGLYVLGILSGSKAQEEISKLANVHSTATGLSRSIVPTAEVELYQAKVGQIEQEVQVFEQLAEQTTARPLISYDVFPKPRSQNFIIIYNEFGQQYVRMIDQLLASMRAGQPPSELEVARRIEEIKEGAGSAGPSQDLNKQIENLIRDFRIQRSNTIQIYASGGSFFGYDLWRFIQTNQSDPANLAKDSWATQLAYWIQEDVVQAIAQVNSGSESVDQSKVKRLIEVSFGGGRAASSFDTTQAVGTSGRTNSGLVRRRGPTAAIQVPQYLVDQSGNLTGRITDSWTGRISDDQIDVVQFELGVVMDVAYLNEFISALQSEKFTLQNKPDGTRVKTGIRNQITVLQFLQESVDRQVELEAGYYFGSGAVGVIRFVCEYFFYKSAYEDLKPEGISQQQLSSSGM